jgi:uncharacterized membrane protein YccC
LRHAVRIAIAVALAAALSRAIGRPNAYWLPITVLLVLQPAFGDTLTRGLGMMTGTAVGAVAATLIASLLPAEDWMLVGLIALIAWLCFTMFRANYAIFAACITAYVVFLVSFSGLPQAVAALYRVTAIMAGGSLALVAYALWPTWEARRVAERLAAALDAQAGYAGAVLAQIATPQMRNDAALAKARLDAQLARSNAEESVERMLIEPRSTGGRLAPSTVLGVLAAMQTFALAGLTLDAARPEAACPPSPSLRPLAKSIEQSLLRIAAALRSGRPVRLPPLRALHARLAGGVIDHGSPGRLEASEYPPLSRLAISETDLMVDSVETIVSLLGTPSVSHAGQRITRAGYIGRPPAL